MHKFLRTMTAAAVAAAMAPAFAADATYNVDVVVVGAGAAGTAAGWAAAEKGLKVVTLEKQAMVGGTGKFSEGIFAVESSMQRNWNYGLTKDEAFQKIMNYGHWRGNAKMVRAFVDKSGETIDWMQANGVKFEKLFSNYPNGLYTWHIYEGRGAGWINLFQQKYKDAGQTLLLNTWGKELIQDKNGTVKGVVATNKNGDKITVNAKATIIATGGFFDNKEMREKYLRFPDADGLAQNLRVRTGRRGSLPSVMRWRRSSKRRAVPMSSGWSAALPACISAMSTSWPGICSPCCSKPGRFLRHRTCRRRAFTSFAAKWDPFRSSLPTIGRMPARMTMMNRSTIVPRWRKPSMPGFKNGMTMTNTRAAFVRSMAFQRNIGTTGMPMLWRVRSRTMRFSATGSTAVRVTRLGKP